MDMEFTSSNEDTDSKERKIFGFENKTDDNSHSDSYDSCEYSKLGIAPEDSCNTVLICFAMLGFVAWFPCYQILVALPYYTQTDKYEWSLIAFPLCLFIPSIFSDAFMLMQWPKIRVSFQAKVKAALLIQLLTTVIFAAFTVTHFDNYNLHIYVGALVGLTILGFCQATISTNVQSLASILPARFTSAVFFG